MSRIRTIKPEFFTSSDIIKMTPLARLFYASLWCESDREGRLKWDIETLKFRYFPAEKCELLEVAGELIERGLIVIYVVEGKEYAEIPSFKKHQVINNRETESSIPPRVKVACTRDSGEGKEGREGKGREGASRNAFDAVAIELPELINKTFWVQWCEFRRSKKKPVSEHAAKLQIQMLSRYDQHVQAQIITKSIQSDYQGLFEPDGQSQPQAMSGRRLQPL